MFVFRGSGLVVLAAVAFLVIACRAHDWRGRCICLQGDICIEVVSNLLRDFRGLLASLGGLFVMNLQMGISVDATSCQTCARFGVGHDN